MINELISKVFFTRHAAHLAHWATTGDGSFARHQALGDFYDEVIGKVDKVMEVYQGNFGRIPKAKLGPTSYDTMEKILSADVKWLEDNMDEISQGVRAIENLLQDLSGQYFHTLYRIENLK